jgi:hypothetical protein
LKIQPQQNTASTWVTLVQSTTLATLAKIREVQGTAHKRNSINSAAPNMNREGRFSLSRSWNLLFTP